MSPLFAAHLIADFLLQPTWLVVVKERRTIGILIHSVIHFATMTALSAPLGFRSIIVITIVAALHGLIDYAKIATKSSMPFWPAFLLDQVAHAIVLILASIVIAAPTSLWQTQSGIGQLALLIFFSFSLALFNMAHMPRMKKSPAVLFTYLSIAFLLFIVPGLLLASSPCPLP